MVQTWQHYPSHTFCFPKHLINLRFDFGGESFKEISDRLFNDYPAPVSLKSLAFINCYYRQNNIDSLNQFHFPSSLDKINFGNLFNLCIAGLKLPPVLEILDLGSDFFDSIYHPSFPKSLKEIWVSRDYYLVAAESKNKSKENDDLIRLN